MDYTLAHYMDAAIERQRLRSDSALAERMNIKQQIVSRWRRGKSYPLETQFRQLVELGECDLEPALLHYRIWVAEDEPARDTYRRLLQRLGTGSGLAVAVAAALALAPSPVEASENSLVSLIVSTANVYYGKFRRFPRRVAAALRFRHPIEQPA